MSRARSHARFALALVGALGVVSCASTVRPQSGDPFIRAFHAIRPTVVLFTMKVSSGDRKRPTATDDAYGSGVIVASDASGSDVLTVEHVIHGARELRATLDERRSVPARVRAIDRENDLALVRIDVPNRLVATLGDAASAEPGTQIGVAGFPIPDAFADERLGIKTSVFAGRVSSVRRDSLELDLPVIPGESGGPIFDARSGSVIALAESRFDEEKAIGFGIPIESARAFMARYIGTNDHKVYKTLR